MRPLTHLLCLLLALPLAGDGLSDLRGALVRLSGPKVALEAKVRFDLSRSQRDGSHAYDAARSTTVKVASGPSGIQVAWPADLMAELRAEDRRFDRDRVFPSPAHDTFRDLRVELLADLLDYAGPLATDLEGCRLAGEDQAPFEGRTLRRLHLEKPAFRLCKNPRLDEPLRWALKDYATTLTAWLAPDGTPVALEERAPLKGSLYLLGFSNVHAEHLRMEVRHGRLMVTRLEVEDQGAGPGTRATNRRIYTVEGA